MMTFSFPDDFVWGCASASYQIEGAPFEDGKGASIWDVFSHTPGRMAGGVTGDIACDAYHRLEEDLDLMQELGIPHYRFSISWPRVIPEGTGVINAAGLAYYDRVVDGCISRGITPWPTLYHWDLPQALQDAGGWTNRETASVFADYAAVIARHFRGRIDHIITLNEPQISVGMGYGTGLHAPGWKLPAGELFACWHHILLAHGLASQAIRRIAPQMRIGVASTGALGYLATHGGPIPDGLQQFTFHTQRPEVSNPADFIAEDAPDPDSAICWFNHQWFLDPICCGHYPEDPTSPWAAYAWASETAARLNLEAGAKHVVNSEYEAGAKHAVRSDYEAGAKHTVSAEHETGAKHVVNSEYEVGAKPSGSVDRTDRGTPAASPIKNGDLESIFQPPDFIGLNIYNGTELDPQAGFAPAPKYPGYPRTSLKWPVTPEVMYWGCRQIWERYHLPLCITENGQGCHDRIFLDGQVHDPDRIDFLHRYLRELSLAIQEGVPVQGYFHWSFTDNLEWHSGYDDRFGLVYVDYRTQRRIPKDSARWYGDQIRSQAGR